MKLPNRISKLIAITLAVAAIAAVGYIGTAEAQNVRVFRGTALAGFIPGQSLYCSMAYLNRSEEGGGPVRVTTYVYDSTGNLLRQTDPVELRRDQFHTFIINRDELPVEGESGTGRAQVRVDFQFQVDASQTLISERNFLASAETVDNRTGATAGGPYFTGSVTVSGDG